MGELDSVHVVVEVHVSHPGFGILVRRMYVPLALRISASRGSVPEHKVDNRLAAGIWRSEAVLDANFVALAANI